MEPIAPSMPHPTCRPKPRVTRYPGIASCVYIRIRPVKMLDQFEYFDQFDMLSE